MICLSPDLLFRICKKHFHNKLSLKRFFFQFTLYTLVTLTKLPGIPYRVIRYSLKVVSLILIYNKFQKPRLAYLCDNLIRSQSSKLQEELSNTNQESLVQQTPREHPQSSLVTLILRTNIKICRK